MTQLLTWLRPWLSLVEGDPLLAIGVAAVAGIALGLSPATYPLVPVVIGYTGGDQRITRSRAAVVSLAFVLGITTVYVALGALWGSVGNLLLKLLGQSLPLWYGLSAALLWLIGLRMVGVLRFGVPLLSRPGQLTGRRGLLGAYLLGLPFGLAGCPSCAPILLAVLTAVAASASPLLGALALLALGLGQGTVLVAAGTFGGSLVSLRRFAGFRSTIERGLGFVLLLAAVYFTWQAFTM